MYTRSNLQDARGAITTFGADAPAVTSPVQSLSEALTSDTAKTAAGVAMIFHGYKRTGSLVWAILYGLAGKTFPLVTVPVAVAQGFATKKACP